MYPLVPMLAVALATRDTTVRRYGPPLAVIGASISIYHVLLEREGWPADTLVDDARSTVANAFGLTGYPCFVAIDAGGEVVARASGELDVESLEALVDAARG